MKKYKNIYYCANFPGKNAGNRRDYLIANTESLITFHYQLGYSKDNSFVEKFENGKSILKKEFGFYKGTNILLRNGIYYLIFLYILFFHVRSNSFVIVTTPIYCIFNSLWKYTKGTNFVYWIEDYFPPTKFFFMRIYNFLVEYYNKRLKYVLYISPPVAKIYNNSINSGKIRKVINLGIKPLKIQKKSPKKKIILGFIGIIRKEQGLDLVFEYVKENLDSKLEVIGQGYDSEYYKSIAKQIGIAKRVIFHGPIDDPSSIVKNWDIAVALYHESKKNFSIYSEPSKIKNYLSFGLPVITTKATYFYKELEKYNAGIAIEENINDLRKTVLKITSGYGLYLKGVKKIQKKYEFTQWYSKKFNFLLE